MLRASISSNKSQHPQKQNSHTHEKSEMGSLQTLKLPVMDFTEPGALNPGSPEWDSLKVQVKEALKEYGCFQAVYNKVPEEVHKALFGALEELFDLPTDTKKLNVSIQPYRGYVGRDPTVFEGMGIEAHADVFDEVENFTKTLWPQGNPNFSKTIHSFSRQVAEVEQMVCRMVFESLGVEKYLEKHMDSTDYILKFMKYSPPQNTTSTNPHIGLPSHTDQTTISIIHDNEVGGLEIQNKNGDWISVQLSPDTFLVMAGDFFHAWSNGQLHNPYHRVTKKGKETRYSIQSFSTPKEGHLVKVPEELVDEQHPLLFKPFYPKEFISFLAASRANGKGDAPIRDYCGI